MTDTVGLIVGLALVVGLVTLFAARAMAWRFGLVDRPDGRRKVQTRPVAVVGGVALFVTTLLALALAAALSPAVEAPFRKDLPQVLWIIAAAALTVAVGVLDDLKNLRARFKLLGQLVATAVAVVGGELIIRGVSVFGYPLDFGIFAVPVTMLWFLAAMNAVNLLDGMDGMLGTLGLVICGSLGVMSLVADHPVPAMISFALCGGLIAFLFFNKPPASVYLGDAGSMFIGLMVAALSIRSTLKGPTVAILAPIALLVLPFLDTSAAIVRRKLTGRGLAVADRGHLHHLLQKRGWSIHQSLLLVGTLGLVAAVGAIISTYYGSDLIAVLAAAFVVLALLVRGLFGVAETRLMAKRAVSAFSATVSRPQSIEMEVRLQGTGAWDQVWQEITRRATALQLTAVYLDVNAPLWQEGYHRRWELRDHKSDRLTGWRVDLPLIGHGQVIGRLAVCGDRGVAAFGEKLNEVSALAHKAEELALHVTLPYVLADTPAPVSSPPAAASPAQIAPQTV